MTTKKDIGELPDEVRARIEAPPMPSIGRIVHYKRTRDGLCEAAIVVRAEKLMVNLQCFEDRPVHRVVYHEGVYFGEDAHNWHWPERV